MFHIMIVDDEPPFVRQLSTMIDKAGGNLLDIHTASNGMEALSYMEENPIQLLITDIRMPVIDGLELIRRAKKLYPELCSMIVSGYSDFEYAQTAIKEEVNDYLLKPISMQQVQKVMADMLERLQGIQERTDQEIVEYLLGEKEIPLDKVSKTLGGHALQALLILNGWYGKASQHEFRVREERKALEQILQLSLEQDTYTCYFVEGNLWMVLLRDPRSNAQIEMEKMLEQEARCCFGMTCRTPELPKLRKDLSEIIERMKRRAKIKGSCNVSKKDFFKGQEAQYMNEVALAEQLIKAKAYDRFQKEFQKMAYRWRECEITQQEAVKRIRRIVQIIYESPQNQLPYDMMLELENLNDEITSFEDLCEIVNVFVDDAFYQMRQKENSGAKLMEKIDAYIAQHMGETILLSEICSGFYVSQPYLSKIVRKYRGMSLNEYVTKLKIEEARKLMEQYPELMVKNISEMLGYEDQRYFSRVFKNMSGYSPTEYMQKVKTHPCG
ncbi:MAG: response regulator [Lachnospiraceae bacterium]|nr:response regulator [Lachnospiraceae bacterium]